MKCVMKLAPPSSSLTLPKDQSLVVISYLHNT